MRYPSPDAILYELLKTYNFTRLVAEAVYLSLTKEPGKVFYSSTHRLIKDRDYLLLSPLVKEEVKEYTLTGCEQNWFGPVELSFEKVVIKEDFHIRKDKNIAYFDYDKLTFPLTLRTWKEGDWFIPFGMKGRKKLIFRIVSSVVSTRNKRGFYAVETLLSGLWENGRITVFVWTK